MTKQNVKMITAVFSAALSSLLLAGACNTFFPNPQYYHTMGLGISDFSNDLLFSARLVGLSALLAVIVAELFLLIDHRRAKKSSTFTESNN